MLRILTCGAVLLALMACSEDAPDGLSDRAPGLSDGGVPTRPIIARAAVEDGSVLIAGLAGVVAEPALRGVILRVTGLAATQGYFDARLVAQNGGRPDDNGVLVLEYRVRAPEVPGQVGPERTRLIQVATFISDANLQQVSGFRVISAGNTTNLRR